MEAMRVGGLMSGMDTNAIVDSLMASAKAPIVKLNQDIDALTFEKTTYNNFIGMLTDVKNAMLPLKMESTFKSKTTTSSKEDVATATAGINTPPGTYTVKVDQVAEPAYATSLYTNKILTSTGAGVTGYSQITLPYDQQEGTHTVDIYKGSNYGYNDKWFAKDTFKGKNNETYSVNHADKAEKTHVNGDGDLTQDIQGDFVFVYEYNGEQKSFPISMEYEKGTPINKIAADLDLEINAKMDILHGNDSKQKMKVTINVDDNGFNFSFYDVDSKNEIEVLGFVDPNQQGQPGSPGFTPTPATQLLDDLGLNATYKSQETKEITNVMVSRSPELLEKKLNDNGSDNGGYFIPGKFEFKEGLTEGTFKIYQDASANCRPETYTTFYGNTFNNMPDDIKQSAINTFLNTKMGSHDPSYFDLPVDDKLNGAFYINGVKIEIDNYKNYTPNELMAKINGSGAGVTMTFDPINKAFKIENNDPGAKELTLGNDTDTSNFFDLFKVSMPSGATYVRGQDSGKIDTTVPVGKTDSGFTYQVKSGTFSINGVSIYVDANKDSVDDIIRKVNNSGAGVTMTYDSNTDKFNLMSTNGKKIKVGGEQDTSTFLLATGLLYHQQKEQEVGTPPKDAIFTVNGTKYERQSNEVDDVIPGMTFNLAGEGTTSISVKTDTDKAVKAMADFAASYNKLVNALNPVEIAYNDDIRSKYSEPLTEEKKATMSEDEIKTYQQNYEKIAYHDIVKRSSELRSIKTSMRANLTKNIQSETIPYKNITEIGVYIAGSPTRDTSITKLGLLFDVSTDPEELEKYIKENSKFVDKVAKDPDGVYAFFAASETVYEKNPTTGKEEKKVKSVGWARTYGDFLDSTCNSTSALYKKASANGSIESQISMKKKQIESQTLRTEMYLERLWAQFAAMEQQVGQMQQQASYLTSLSTGGAK